MIQTDLRAAEAMTSQSATGMTADLDRLVAHALRGGVMIRSASPVPWSEATKDRLYRRMFPDDATPC